MKQTVFLIMLFVAVSFSTYAQGPGGQVGMRRTVEERVKMVHNKYDSTFKFDAAKQAKVDTAYATLYRAQNKMFEEMREGGGTPDRDAMREKMQKLNDEKDATLKSVLTDAEFKKVKEELEPSMRPQRGPGGQGGPGGGGQRPRDNN